MKRTKPKTKPRTKPKPPPLPCGERQRVWRKEKQLDYLDLVRRDDDAHPLTDLDPDSLTSVVNVAVDLATHAAHEHLAARRSTFTQEELLLSLLFVASSMRSRLENRAGIDDGNEYLPRRRRDT